MITDDYANYGSGSKHDNLSESNDTIQILEVHGVSPAIQDLVLGIADTFKNMGDIISFTKKDKEENKEVFEIFEEQVRDLVIPRIINEFGRCNLLNPEAADDRMFYEELIQFYTGL